jgi:hypothetical protein
MSFQGVERDNAIRAAGQLEDCAIALLGVMQRVELARRALVWEGDDAKVFTEDWDFQFIPDLLNAARRAAEYADGIHRTLARQEQISEE